MILTLERWGPIGAAAFGFGALLIYQNQIIAQFVSAGWSLTNLYTAIFDWSAIQTGFMFGVYGFVVGKTDGFIGAAKKNVAMTKFVRYTLWAVAIGFLLTLVSAPLIVIDLKINASFIFIAAWFSIFVWAFLAFCRVALLFGLMIQVRENEVIKG